MPFVKKRNIFVNVKPMNIEPKDEKLVWYQCYQLVVTFTLNLFVRLEFMKFMTKFISRKCLKFSFSGCRTFCSFFIRYKFSSFFDTNSTNCQINSFHGVGHFWRSSFPANIAKFHAYFISLKERFLELKLWPLT